MGVLYYADGLHQPSLVWMRRMLESLGDDVSVLVTETDPGATHSGNCEVVVVREGLSSWWWRACHRLGLEPGIRKSGKAITTVARAMASNEVDVVLMHYLTQGIKYDRVWPQIEKPVFIHCHGFDVTWDLRSHHPPHEPEHASNYLDRVRALPDHVHLITNSKVTTQRLLDVGFPENRIHLKYLGVPVPSSPPPIRVRPRGVTILYLSRLVDCKGPEVVVRAFDLARQRGLRGRLIIAGDGPMRYECERARAEAQHGESIELLGAVDAATGSSLRDVADIFTAHNRRGPLTGQEEAFGVAFVEAMAAGLPIVSGRNGSLPELVDDGVHGILIEPNDVESHAQAFLRLATDADLRAEMGRKAWQRARDRFSTGLELRRLRRILGLEL